MSCSTSNGFCLVLIICLQGAKSLITRAVFAHSARARFCRQPTIKPRVIFDDLTPLFHWGRALTSTGTSLWPRLSPTRMTSGSCGTKTTVDEAPKHVTSRDHLNKVPRRLESELPFGPSPLWYPLAISCKRGSAWSWLAVRRCGVVRPRA